MSADSHIFPRHSKAAPPTAIGGEGCWIIDQNAKRYLDGSGGAAVSCLGHGDQEVIRAVQEQLGGMAYAHTGFFTSLPAERLASRLIEAAPKDGSHELDRVYLVSGGSEAMEAAIKLARQYFLEIGQPRRDVLIARKQSYHGNTLGALSVGGNAWRRAPFAPLLSDVRHIEPCYPYRHQREDESAEAYALRAADLLEAEIQAAGPDRVIAFVAETVVGATAGAVAPPPGYFKRIREICDRHGVLLILDEVMCGMGRTGRLFACEEDGVAPDILAIAKGLGAGYQPIGAMLCTKAIYAAIEAGSGFFQHGHTYMGHPSAAAAGLAVLEAFERRQLIPRVAEKGEVLQARLEERLGQHPHVGDIRGRGLFRGVELVADRESRQPFDPAQGVHKKVKAAAFEAGLICYPMGGCIDGQQGDHVLLAPPFIIEDGEIDFLVDTLALAIDAATAGA